MRRHWVYDYLGKQWSADGEGPDSYNCWNLVRAVHLRLHGRHLPVFEPTKWNFRGYATAFGEECVSQELTQNWIEQSEPDDLDIVILGRAVKPSHIGLWVGHGYNGRVLHCVEPSPQSRGISGVVAQQLQSMRLQGWGLVKFYRHREMLCNRP